MHVQDITWVLTVPAIWTDSAKQFMREAAVQVCKAALLFWFFGGFRCGVPLFIVMLVIF